MWILESLFLCWEEFHKKGVPRRFEVKIRFVTQLWEFLSMRTGTFQHLDKGGMSWILILPLYLPISYCVFAYVNTFLQSAMVIPLSSLSFSRVNPLSCLSLWYSWWLFSSASSGFEASSVLVSSSWPFCQASFLERRVFSASCSYRRSVPGTEVFKKWRRTWVSR